ncbi:hypothetical protein [Roseibium sediminicola]|uniref:Uncharacterized protein n=1 Tax=Roseibium sediminicola TaxID=2933272 RepID=A0ABT0H2C5_9HYPH|nr:hypothetical protein [Roseibium sp. CAU 1639]MCK7615824.1 hypothetical protein [Roseibium sp. CAU 1639]
MKQFDLATTAAGSTPLLDTGLFALSTVAFFLVVLGYFLSSEYFQSKRRRSRFSGDGPAFIVSGCLFVAFTASYLEIFLTAFRLPFSTYVELLIGLLAVAAAGIGAYAVSNFVRTRWMAGLRPAR